MLKRLKITVAVALGAATLASPLAYAVYVAPHGPNDGCQIGTLRVNGATCAQIGR